MKNLTRRDFLKYSGAGAGALGLVALTGCGSSAISVDDGSSSSSGTSSSSTSESSSTEETTGTEETTADQLTFAEGTVLRMATGYNSAKTGLFFNADIAGEGITLADGNTYQSGDLKPTWVEAENRLGMTFEDKYQGNGSSSEFEYWKDRLNEVDMVLGSASTLTEYGESGYLVNIGDYLDMMPNFKAYLEENTIVRLSITGNTDTGAIYFSPYFDGVNDIERMPLMRTDWAEKLLNGEGEFTADSCDNTATPVYQPYMPTSGTLEIEVVTADGSGVETVTKDYDAAGNIVQLMNDAGSVDGVTAVNMLRDYIDTAYNGYYGTNRADLFIGQNAAWDADEMVALLRCVTANTATVSPNLISQGLTAQGIFSREDSNTQRRLDLVRLAGELFGIRGLESRNGYLYVGADGTLVDARQEEDTYLALDRMRDMAAEGLISESFINSSEETSSTMLENDLGFMSYDYNQTQTILNETELQQDEGEKYRAIMVPVALWYDGTSDAGVYMRFTESWRSVKTDAWAISVAGVEGDQDKLYAALKLIDYAYSDEGMILMSYGPDAFIKTNADGSYETFDFNGEQMPVIADETYEELWELASGNYTNFARYYLGSTLTFVKLQSFEYQCTSDAGKEGAAIISNGIATGVIHHVELEVADNSWYTCTPTVLPYTTTENEMIGGYTDLTTKFSGSKGEQNLFIDIMASGYSEEGVSDAATMASTVTNNMSGKQYLTLANDAWDRLLEYYETL
ncbi:MAG: substrate-binding domain-containing protein [Lachnospiraceae bacterium]|nr:substrate-binding domain-containing protein [Lachnospiraceae bacterium]